ncbi:DNA modification methylase [Candidatus Bandiella numerosa]|uniref:DNA modification methylase n=1 Tax=Candidatus Bandiella numerosa TaxID=2570586 RepID=UPI001F39D55F|nr:DNA methyltransferase [Candidatus Bandiella numerosa]
MKWTIKEVKISDLKEYDKNPRKIKKEQLDKLTAHINEDGYHQRIIVNTDYTIIGGHQRKKALLQAGYKPSDVIEVLMPEWTLQQQELDRINVRDNLNFGEFDFDILQEQFNLEELEEFGFDKEFLETLEPVIIPSIDEDEIEQLPANPVSKLGDLYILGNHRLLCGDSTNAEHVSRLLDGTNPILMVTDPPYGVSYKPEWREVAGKGARAKGTVLNDDRYDWSDAYSLFTGDVAYIWHSSSYTHKFAEHIENCDFKLISLIIWSKQHFALSRGDYHGQHEPLWYAVKRGRQHNWQGKRDQSTIWEINNNNVFGGGGEEQTGHGTQKPIECMLRPIINNSKVGEGVYDPFGGSGTTLIACEKSDRNCYMMELSPAYVDIIVQRWEKITGEKAVLHE